MLPPPSGPSPLRQAVRSAMSALLPRSLFLTSGPAREGAVALTFDDGPHPVHTPAILDTLRALDVRATFFVVGARAAEHPEIVARMAREGHAVGHHSWSHTPPPETSARALRGEARRTADFLAERIGAHPRLFRPPHGSVTAAKLLGLWTLGQTIVLWNRDPRDFAAASHSEVRAWFEREPLAAGDVLLLHDAHPHAGPALPVLVERARALGLGFVTIEDWLVPRRSRGTAAGPGGRARAT